MICLRQSLLLSRISGWTAHILEQYDNNRLIRPRAEYVGPGMQKYVPIERKITSYISVVTFFIIL